jgi:hypothetical protein
LRIFRASACTKRLTTMRTVESGKRTENPTRRGGADVISKVWTGVSPTRDAARGLSALRASYASRSV